MGEQSYVLQCKIEVASGAIAREFDLGRYQYRYKVVAAREREDSGRVIWRLRHTDPDFLLGSLECVPGRGDTTRLIVEDPPITIWKPTALEEVDGDFDRLAEETERRIREAEARDVSHRSIQVMLVEDLLHTLEADYDIPVSSPAAEAAFAGRRLAELPSSSDPSPRAGQSDLTLVNLYSTAGTMSPGLYPAKPGQAKAIELANAAISNLKYQFGNEAAGVTEERNEKGSKAVGMVDELLRPMNVNWPISKLKRWFMDFSDDNGLHLVVFHSPAKGYIDIYKDPFTYVGIKGEPQADGQILLTPYITDKATSEAVEELQRWRDALVVAIEDDTLAPKTSITSGDMDEDENLALLVKRYSPKLGRNLRTTTIQTWLHIAEHKRRVVSGEVVLLTDAQVVERTGINQDTYDTHKKDMKKSGFWRDYGLDPE